MRKGRCIVLILLLVVVVALAYAQEPALFQPARGGPARLPASDDACWSEPPDLNAAKISSEIIAAKGWECEVANDFLTAADAGITHARYFGGPFGFVEGDSTALTFQVRFYDSREATAGIWEPDSLIESYSLALSPEQVGADGYGFPVHRFDARVRLCIRGNTVYWMSVVALDHPFTLQWGRTCTREIRNAETVIRCPSAGYTDWIWIADALGLADDLAQEFACYGSVEGGPCETPVRRTRWGTVRALYR